MRYPQPANPKMRLTDGTATLSFTPGRYRRPDLYFKTYNEAIDGTLRIYKRGNAKEFHEVEIILASAGTASTLNAWAKNNTTVTFTYDIGGAGSTAITAMLVNENRPMQMWEQLWNEFHSGTILVREI